MTSAVETLEIAIASAGPVDGCGIRVTIHPTRAQQVLAALKSALEALEFIAEQHDTGRHDGLPEACPAHDAITMWATADRALSEISK